MLAERVREGVREMGGIVLGFPIRPIREAGRRPTAGLACLKLVVAAGVMAFDGRLADGPVDRDVQASSPSAADRASG